MLRGNPSGTVCFTPILMLQLSETKKQRQLHEWKSSGTQYSPTPCSLHHLDLLCPSQDSLFCCRHAWSHTWSRKTEKTQMAYLSDRGYYWGTDRTVITLPECTAPGVWLPLHAFSDQLVFLQKKGGVQLFRSSWILCHKTTK